MGLLLFSVWNVSHSGIIFTSDTNWFITIEKMTATNKVKTMVSPVHVAGLIVQVRVYVTLKFSSSYFDLRNMARQ